MARAWMTDEIRIGKKSERRLPFHRLQLKSQIGSAKCV